MAMALRATKLTMMATGDDNNDGYCATGDGATGYNNDNNCDGCNDDGNGVTGEEVFNKRTNE